MTIMAKTIVITCHGKAASQDEMPLTHTQPGDATGKTWDKG